MDEEEYYNFSIVVSKPSTDLMSPGLERHLFRLPVEGAQEFLEALVLEGIEVGDIPEGADPVAFVTAEMTSAAVLSSAAIMGVEDTEEAMHQGWSWVILEGPLPTWLRGATLHVLDLEDVRPAWSSPPE